MSGLVFACIAPHGSLIIPLLGEKGAEKGLATRTAMEDLGRLLTFDQAWLKRAATDAYGQILNLHGAIEGTAFRGEFLSYEVPTYFGMMCVVYEPPQE